MTKLAITQVRSSIHRNPSQLGTLRALGLDRRGRTVEFEDSPQLQGQLKVITHLVKVEEV